MRHFTTNIASPILAMSMSMLSYNAATAAISSDVMTAACRAQNYLQKNGYLLPIENYNRETLYVDILDRMAGKASDESIAQLLKGREGTFINKLYGVMVDQPYTRVAYRFETTSYSSSSYYLRCVMMRNDNDAISLIHQNCLDKNLMPISEADLDC